MRDIRHLKGARLFTLINLDGEQIEKKTEQWGL